MRNDLSRKLLLYHSQTNNQWFGYIFPLQFPLLKIYAGLRYHTTIETLQQHKSQHAQYLYALDI